MKYLVTVNYRVLKITRNSTLNELFSLANNFLSIVVSSLESDLVKNASNLFCKFKSVILQLFHPHKQYCEVQTMTLHLYANTNLVVSWVNSYYRDYK